MNQRRIVINLSVPFFLFFVRWVVVALGNRIAPRMFDKATSGFDKAKNFARLGWDFTAVGFGFYLSAFLSGDSVLSMWADNCGGDVGACHLKIVATFVIFTAFYVGAIFVRFCLMEKWDELELLHRAFYGLILWVLGFVIMGTTSALAVRAPRQVATPTATSSSARITNQKFWSVLRWPNF